MIRCRRADGKSGMAPVVALLRSVNVGGNRMKMAWLRELAADVGCRDVRTVLATGNLLMAAPDDLEATRIALEEALAADYGRVDVMMRTRQQMVDVVARNPWRGDLDAGAREGRFVHTMFLRDEPDADTIAALDPPACADEFVVDGREVFVAFATETQSSPLGGAWFERRLGTGTMRNDNSVRKVVAALVDLS